MFLIVVFFCFYCEVKRHMVGIQIKVTNTIATGFISYKNIFSVLTLVARDGFE